MRQIESFFLGIIAALGALVIESLAMGALSFSAAPWSTNGTSFASQLLSEGNTKRIFLILFFLAFIEELFKYLVLAKKVDQYSLGRTMILNSILVGCGFAATELFFIFKGIAPGIINFANFRNFAEIFIIHASTAGIMGYFLAIADKIMLRTFCKPVLIATIIHLFYNALLLYSNYYIAPIITVLAALLIFVNIANLLRINRHLAI